MNGTCIYDGECGVCQSLAGWVAERSDCAIRPARSVDLASHGISTQAASSAMHWVSAEGDVRRGAAAVAEVLLTMRGLWPILGRILRLPGIRSLGEIVYRFVVRHRHRLPGGSTACQIDRPDTARSD